MPAMNIAKSIKIDASPENVYDTIADFTTWQLWSPWLCADKNATVTVSENSNSVGSGYAWDGEVVGAGELEHIKLDRPHRIDDEIRFTRPWKSVSKVVFELKPSDSGTTVTWKMLGKLPWFLFWLKSTVEPAIGMDYERGLSMLKEHIETGQVLSDTDVVGVVSVPKRVVQGSRTTCQIKKIDETMPSEFEKASSAIGSSNCDGCEMISVYHKFDIKSGEVDFTGGFTNTDSNVAAGLQQTVLPAGKALHIRHTGSYQNLGNGWGTGYQFARYKKLKLNGKVPAYEIYRNRPEDTPVSDLVTDIYLPLKA